MIVAPSLYVGTIRHRRFAPRAHEFQYALFMTLLDLDHLADAMRVSRWTSYNRWNWAAFDERDYRGDPSRPLRGRVVESAAAAGIALPDGAIYLLTHLRYLGYSFNPISLFYCCDRDGGLVSVLADVRNTYGGRHHYWLQANGSLPGRFRAVAPKAMYVSPFMDLDVDYEFVLTPPGSALVAHMNVLPASAADPRRPLFDATLSLQRRPWTAGQLRRALFRFPWMSAQVIAAVHWEALRLRGKGLPVMPFAQEER